MIQLNGTGGYLPFYYQLMEYIWDEVRVVVLDIVVGSLVVEGGDSVLLMDGITFVIGLKILDRELTDGWISH